MDDALASVSSASAWEGLRSKVESLLVELLFVVVLLLFVVVKNAVKPSEEPVFTSDDSCCCGLFATGARGLATGT